LVTEQEAREEGDGASCVLVISPLRVTASDPP